MITATCGDQGGASSAATTTVAGPAGRAEENPPGPLVAVIRRRPSVMPVAASTSLTAPRNSPAGGSSSPRAPAERARRARCRPTANACPAVIRTLSKTPSPTSRPWSRTETHAADSGTIAPFSQTTGSPTRRRLAVAAATPGRVGGAPQGPATGVITPNRR